MFTPPPVLKTNDKARSWLYRAVVDDNQRQIRDASTKYSRDRAKKHKYKQQTTNKVSKPNDNAGSAGLYSSKSPGAVVDDNALSQEGGHHLVCLVHIYGVNEHKYK